MNKKGSEKYLSWVNVAAWLLIFGVITIGLLFYTNSETNVKPEESKSLNQKITDCLVKEDGSLSYPIDENLDIYTNCNLNRDVFEEDRLYFVKIEIQKADLEPSSFTFGNTELEIQCQIQETENSLPDCYKSTIKVQDSGEKILTITSASSNKEAE